MMLRDCGKETQEMAEHPPPPAASELSLWAERVLVIPS